MPRFDKLEFEGSAASGADPEPPPIVQRQDIDWIRRADQDRRRGFYENALKYYSRALEIDKSRVSGWLGQVQMLVLLQELPEAELWARKALELFPAHGDLLAGRAQALCRMGDRRRAHEACDGAMKQSGLSAYRWIVRGELMLASRQATDQHCFDKAWQLDRDWLVPLEIALVGLHYGNPSRALPRARQACESAPDQPLPWLVLARCQTAMGLAAPARESLQHCLDLCPGHAEARQQLVELQQPSLSLLARWLRGLIPRWRGSA